MADTLTWTRDGVTYTASPPAGTPEAGQETKEKWTAARAAKNPRDSEGRFIETGAEVRVLGVGVGRVLGTGSAGKTRVQLGNGGERSIPNGSLTVLKRPDGSDPTDDPEDLKPQPKKPVKPAAAPSKPGEQPTPEGGREQRPIKTAADVRDHWVMGAQFQPDLPDQHREFLRNAGKNAVDLQLSDGGQLVLLQVSEGGPWRVTNHHGQGIGPEQPDAERARAVANALERGLVDADGVALDYNSPGFPERAKAFKTAEGESLGRAANRILEEATKEPTEPLRTEPWTSQDLRALGEKYGLTVNSVGSGDKEHLKLTSPRQRPGGHGFRWQAWNGHLATSNGGTLQIDEVEPYLRLYAANPNEHPMSLHQRAQEEVKKRREVDKSQGGDGQDGGTTPPPDVSPEGGDGAAADPDVDVLPPLDTSEAVRAYWESGGEGNPDLSDDDRSLLRHAAKRHVEIRMSDDGNLVLARQLKTGPWRILNLSGRPTFGDEVATLARARDLARRLERDMVDADGAPLDWNDPDEDRRLAFRSDRGEPYEQVLERILAEHRAASDAAGSSRGKQGVSKVGDAAAVRAYWAQGGREEPPPDLDSGRWESHRGALRWKAENLEDLKVSPGGKFALTRVRKGRTWDVVTIEGYSIPSADRTGFATEKQAREFAARIEAEVVDADGQALDWNAPDIGDRIKAFRTRGGETTAQAIARIQKGGPEPAPVARDPEPPAPAPTPELDTPEKVRAHWAAGGAPGQKLPTPERLQLLAAEAHDIRLSPGGSLVLVQDKKGKDWRLTNLHGGPLPSEANQTSLTRAQAMAERIEALRDADGNAFDWNAPDVGGRAREWRNSRHLDLRQAVGQAIEEQREANKPKPKPAPVITPKLTPPGQPITSVEQLRNHLAAGGDDKDPNTREVAQRLATAEGLVLVAGNTFAMRPWKAGSDREWVLVHARTARGATPTGSKFNRAEAVAFANRLKTLYDENGQPFDWDAPDVNERLGRIPNRDEQIHAIVVGETPPKPDPIGATTKPPSGGFKSIDELREHYLRLANDLTIRERHRTFLRHQAKKEGMLLSPGGGLMLDPIDRRTMFFAHAATGLQIKGGEAIAAVQSEWGGRKAHLELAHRLETRVLDANGKPLDWTQPNLQEIVKDWRSEFGENALDASYRVKGEWDHENGKETLASRDYAMQAELPDRPASTERRAYGDEVKPGDILHVDHGGNRGFAIDKRVTAVEPVGWGRYELTFEDDTKQVVTRNQPLMRGVSERYVTNADGEVIGERVPKGVLKPGDRVQFTAEGGSTFNVRDQETLKQGGINGYGSVQVEGTLVEEADPDGRGRTRTVLKGVVIRQGRASVTLPNLQRDRQGRATSYALPASVTRLGETSASDADRDTARDRRLAEEAELDRAVLARQARTRVLSSYRIAVPESASVDQAELERRRGELANADQEAVDAAAAQLQVMAANTPKTLSGQSDTRHAQVAAYAAAIGERMEALGHLRPAPGYILGWETADGLRSRSAGARERILAGDRLDEDSLRGVVDMAIALGNRDLVDAVAAERERRGRQPAPESLHGEALAAALTGVDEPTGRAAGELLRVLAVDDPEEKPRPQTVRGWWLDFHEAVQRAMQREDINDPTADWLQRVSDDVADRMREAGHRPINSENVERLAEYAAMDVDQLRRELDGMRYASDAYDDLVEVLESRGYNESGHRPYGSDADLAAPQQPSKDLIGTRVAVHDGQGGWIQGFLHKRRTDWILSQSPDDPGNSPVTLRERGDRSQPSVTPVGPGHPALADLGKEDYSVAELDGELNRLAPEIQALWAADRRRGDPEFDRLFSRYNELIREREERPDPEPAQITQDEALFDTGGAITGDATPEPIERRGEMVAASTLAVGDRIDDGEIERITRVRELVFTVVRDRDDARIVRGFAPDTQVRRRSASGEAAPEPVTVADVASGDLAEGDRVLLTRADGHLSPATITSVTTDGDRRVLDVRYDDGGAELVEVDRAEALPRLGGPEASDGVTGLEDDAAEPLDEPPTTVRPVPASTLAAGDRVMFSNQIDAYTVVSADHSGGHTVLNLRRDRDGWEAPFGVGKNQTMFKIEAGAPAPADGGAEDPGDSRPAPDVPEALPESTTSARPVLYTYQRRNLNWLGLTASDDATVRQAALRIRDRMPLSAEQAAALAAAVRAQAADATPAKRRTADRLAYSLEAAAAQARGVPKPRRTAREGGAFKAYARNMVEGDTVALPTASGRARVGKVTGKRTLMGGRLVQLDIEYADGSTESRLLTARTDGWVLPDPPEDVKLPPTTAAPRIAQVDLAVYDLEEKLREFDYGMREGMLIAAEGLAGRSFDSRDAAVAAFADASSRGNPDMYLSNTVTDILRPRGWRGRSIPYEDARQVLTGARDQFMREVLGRLPERGPVDYDTLIEAANYHSETNWWEPSARALADGHDGGVSEHITINDLQPGDVIAGWRGEYEVMEVASRLAAAVTVRLAPTGWDPRGQRNTFTERYEMPRDRGPSIVRVARGEYSADQPWDGIIRDDEPEPGVRPEDVRAGDRLLLDGFGAVTFGRVEEVARIVEGGGTLLRIRREDGGISSLPFVPNQPAPNIIRLQKATDDFAAQLARERAEREEQAAIAAVSNTLASVARQVWRHHTRRITPKVLAGGQAAIARTMWDGPSISEMYDRDMPDRIADALGIDRAIRKQVSARLFSPVLDVAVRAHETLRDSLYQAKPAPGETAQDALQRVIAQFRDTPPGLSEAYTTAARALVGLRSLLAAEDQDDRPVPDMPTPASGTLAERMDAYRAALGDPAQFGQVRVRRAAVKEFKLADLEAGKTPDVEFAEMWVGEQAADGGPGPLAMRHLDILRAAGRELDDELNRRMDAAGVQQLQAEIDAVNADLGSVGTRELAVFYTLRDRYAAEAGFDNYSDMSDKMRSFPSHTDEYRKMHDLTMGVHRRATDENRERTRRVKELQQRIADERRRAAIDILGEVRADGMGGARIDWYDKTTTKGLKQLTERSELVKALRSAEAAYPTTWLKLFQNHARSRGRMWRVGKIKRGHYSDAQLLINLSDEPPNSSQPKMAGVAIHEMGHGMERAVPGLMEAEQAYLWSRTSTGEIGDRTRETKTMIYAGEYGYKDQFPEHYTGKDYIRGGRADAFEMFTTGVESLMAGSPYLDDDFRRWMLGTMALLGTSERAGTDSSPGGSPARAPQSPASAPAPASDEEYEAYTQRLEQTLNKALADGLATDKTYTLNGDGVTYAPERALQHREIIDELMASAADVPSEGKAVIAGGLGGAGKSTVLQKFAGLDLKAYATANPDDVKEIMAKKGMIPQVEGLSPMEASPLVHEESSLIAALYALQLYRQRKNIIWDITMSRRGSVEKRVAELRQAGYEDLQAVFVDIPVEVSVQRALSRHRRGVERYAEGRGLGGRYVPPHIIRANASATSSSANREVFDSLRDQFTSWQIWDNSVMGRDPQPVASSQTRR